jgi:hypothetical protein
MHEPRKVFSIIQLLLIANKYNYFAMNPPPKEKKLEHQRRITDKE